jgi:hypothetical protein
MTRPRVYRHSWFLANRSVRWDTKRFKRWGWYYALGWKKPETPVYEWSQEYRHKHRDHIDGLGGGSWRRLGPRPSPLFFVRYRCP